MRAEDQEPTGWELMRGLERIEKTLNEFTSKVVSVDVYNADKVGNTQRHERAEARIKDLEVAGTEAEKLRRSTRLAIAIAIVSPLLSVAGAFLVKVVSP